MALSDLSLVTRSMVTLLTQAFITSDAWPDAPPPVLPEPPSRVTQNGLGFYLYHVQENSSYQNLPDPTNQQAETRFTHLALNLHFQLSANSLLTNEAEGAFDEQTMMGIAMKALHDYPEINDDTFLGGVQVMHPLLRGRDNFFKTLLQPIQASEAFQYWTAGTSPIKLSAYYELRVVLMAPDTVQSRAGRVLTYGVHTFAHGAPRIINNQNILRYTPPNSVTERRLKIQPAQVPPSHPSNSQITFWGSGLNGDLVEVLLLGRWASWNNRPALADSSWNINSQDVSLQMDVQETALLESGDPADILPGVYGVQARISRYRTMPDGQSRAFSHLSNQCPITVSPRIDTITPPGVDPFFSVDGYRWEHPDLDPELIQVYLGSEGLLPGDPNILAPGEFGVASASELRFIPPAAPVFTSGQLIPLRIFVNGAESPPNWITIP